MPDTILGLSQLCLWPQSLFSLQDAATSCYEFGRLHKATILTIPLPIFSARREHYTTFLALALIPDISSLWLLLRDLPSMLN